MYNNIFARGLWFKGHINPKVLMHLVLIVEYCEAELRLKIEDLAVKGVELHF